MNTQPLLTPVKLGRYRLANRVVMAPLTRSRAYNRDRAPTELHAQYYAQRASAGLIVTEGSQISPQGVGYVYTPGIHTAAQIRAWKKVTDAVHAEGGHIFSQLWHVGYVSHPDFHDGALPVAPSAINPRSKSFTPQGLKDTVTPRPLETDEVKAVVRDYVRAARNAVEAGFDGVEIHGANGYLIEQFLRDSTNKRSDEYGGSIPNRARFLFEIVEGISDAIGADRTGVRLSPANTWNVPPDSDTQALYDFVIGALSSYELAYLHLREAQGDLSAIPNMVQNVTAHYRTVYRGTLITNTGYDRDKGNTVIAKGDADLVAYGVPYIANPDLVERFRVGAPLAQADQSTFYQGGARGYTDYPSLQAEAA
ncbi:MAG: alkene reductase [Gammaproteobacteria bacterium]|nr:alkene reductase [Gammaproteobacteria bacterium]MDE1887387.1 alkene reductase [Gammaproteobacteria bacterium]MDE2023418.1 alkene reductase [Gammaproteobacteria bacterium]MDE2138866.1 alkene reductase [Gammaproteobacteria bacterium]MDE2273326.1 alkene reductase [Gammaproteobacteria bacterium]